MDNKNIKFEDIKPKKVSLSKIQEKLSGFTKQLSETKDPKEALKVIRGLEKYMDKFANNATVISINYSLNTTDKHIAKLNDHLDEISPHISNEINKFNKVLVKHPCRKELEEKLTPYYFQMIDNSLKSFDEKIIPELIEINKLSSQYDRIMGGAQIEFRGQVYNIPQMGKFAKSKDRETRREASIAVDKFFQENEQNIGEIYGNLVLLRDKAAKKLGFKNYIELGYLSLGRVDYDAKMVAGYRKQIADDVVPICQKLYKEQAARIGIPFSQMKSYDYNLSFLSGNPTPKGDAKQLVKQATKMYEEMSPETGEFFHMMQDHHLLDLEARAGKQPGGYMTFLPVQKFPFIFANFNGTEHDVNVLTHEVGHAFQGYLSRNIKPGDFRSPTLESCEIHSMSMEFFAWPWMSLFFDDEAEKYRYAHLSDSIEFLPYGITIDEFQHWVYEHPTATHEERCAAYKEIESRYTPHKKYDDEMKICQKGGWWMRQSHIFGVPFYYIDYTLAQVCAFQFLVEMTRNREKAWKKYVKLCKLGGRYPFVTLLGKAHLRNPFEEGNIHKVMVPLKGILKSFDLSKIK